MLFTKVLLALAAACPVFTAPVPSTEDVSSEKVLWVFVLLKVYLQVSLAKRSANEDTMLRRAGVPVNSARDLETSKGNDGNFAIEGTITCCSG